eukprot:6202910-Pleurochrysis_carterae.AAC.1
MAVSQTLVEGRAAARWLRGWRQPAARSARDLRLATAHWKGTGLSAAARWIWRWGVAAAYWK